MTKHSHPKMLQKTARIRKIWSKFIFRLNLARKYLFTLVAALVSRPSSLEFGALWPLPIGINNNIIFEFEFLHQVIFLFLRNEDKVSEKLQKELEMENDEKTHDVSYFKNILKKNDDAMAHFVKVWTNKVNEMERSNVKEDICGKIRSTIGKAILLTNKKGRFEQFRTLIENCEFGLGEKATTCMDLQVSI